jgi:hypothetical protein
MTQSYSTSADYDHIDVALKSFWKPFNELLNEMDSFVPLPLSKFDSRKSKLTKNLRKLNPKIPDEKIIQLVEKQIASIASADMQFWGRFSDRFMTMQVTVTLLSLALCEAMINAILAEGLYIKGAPEKFAEIEGLGIKEKWVIGPKTFCANYELKKSSAIYETLKHLSKQRNSWMHSKIDLHVGEKKILEGSNLHNRSYKDSIRWMKRYFSLPYDLATHAHRYTNQSVAFILFYKRNPIPIAEAHK